MVIITQMYLSCSSNISKLFSAIQKLSDLSGIIQNLWWLILIFVIILSCICSLLNIRGKANRFTRKQIEQLNKTGKYIPGLFVELNGSKEVLRYFVYKNKWKKRLIRNFNIIYKNAYGDILKKACKISGVRYKLNKSDSLEKIENTTRAAFDFHNNFNSSTVEFEPSYKESKILFELLRYPYKDALMDVYQCSSAANRKYFVLTGSAGNGKTNLLCSISELLMKIKESVIFLNARDIEGDILSFLLQELKVHDLCKIHAHAYLSLLNFWLRIQKRHLFIIVDAINENNSAGFGERVAKFINDVLQYDRINVIASCRSEYYRERFRKHLVENIDIEAFEFDLKKQQYTQAAIDQIIRAYTNYFKFDGKITFSVRYTLSKQLLLLRVFFEVNKDSTAEIFTIRKHEIFAQYVEVVTQTLGINVEKVLNSVADFMLDSENYIEVNLSDLENSNIDLDVMKKSIDSSILLSKKLVSHGGTIAQKEDEVLYFVFDEMRDYCLARRILLRNISSDSINGEAVLEKIKHLRENGAPCEEGVIHYCYIFFRTDEIVKKSNQTKKMCNEILDLYRIPKGRQQKPYWNWNTSHGEEFQNLGLRIILTSGMELSDFEISYIQDCLEKDPYEDGKIIFDTMLDGTLYGGIYSLEIYLDILFGLKERDAMLNAFSVIDTDDRTGKRFDPEEFIQYYIELEDPKNKLHIQETAELYLLCFELHDANKQKKLEKFFYSLPTHGKVQEKMLSKMRAVWSSEAGNYE